MEEDWGIRSSHTIHTIEEQIGEQLQAEFISTDIYGDTDDTNQLYAYNIPTYYATRAVKR